MTTTQRISLKVKDLGEIAGEFLRTSKNGVWLKNVAFGKAVAPQIEMIKVSKSSILGVFRQNDPPFHLFTDAELEYISALASCKYSGAATLALKSRGSSNVARNVEENVTSSAETVYGSSDTAKIFQDPFAQQQACDTFENTESDKVSVKEGSTFRKILSKGRKETEWNQLEANAKLYGIMPLFNINDYATPINCSDKDYEKKKAASMKIAQKILQEATTDPHKLEERGLRVPSENKSDDTLYSTVVTGKWEKKVAPKEEETEKTEDPEILEVVKEYKSKVNSAISEGNKDSMWANVSSLLSAKKKVEDRLKEKEEPKVLLQKEQSSSKATGAPSSEHSATPKNAKKADKGNQEDNNNPTSESSTNQSSLLSKFEPADQSSTSQSSATKKSAKQLIIGKKLKYEKTSSLISSIISNISNNVNPSLQSFWGSALPTVENAERYLPKESMLLPSRERLSEIEAKGNTRYFWK